MPKDFLNCVKNKGKVRTVVPKRGIYIRVCYLDGKSYSGEVMKTKKDTKKKIAKENI